MWADACAAASAAAAVAGAARAVRACVRAYMCGPLGPVKAIFSNLSQRESMFF